MILDTMIIIVALLLRLLVILVGLVVIPLALPFAKETGESNSDGWKRIHFPKWAWLWDNSRNGIAGSKYNKSLSGEGKGFWWRYNWTALRNPAHNFSRHILGLDRQKIKVLEYKGSLKEADEGVPGYSYYRAYTQWLLYPGYVWSGRIGSRMYSFYAGWKIRKDNSYLDDGMIGFTVAFERWA